MGRRYNSRQQSSAAPVQNVAAPVPMKVGIDPAKRVRNVGGKNYTVVENIAARYPNSNNGPDWAQICLTPGMCRILQAVKDSPAFWAEVAELAAIVKTPNDKPAATNGFISL